MLQAEYIPLAIAKLPFKKLTLGFRVINIIQPENLVDEQEVYRQNLSGATLMRGREGDWQPSWMVIATDELGLPIFTDINKPNLPIYTATREEDDSWKVYYIATSLELYFLFLEMLHKVSDGRETVAEMELNPIPEIISEAILNDIEKKCPDIDLWYWELFMESFRVDEIPEEGEE
jgi:hypothetical protein